MSFLKSIKTATELEAERIESLAKAVRAKRDALIKETDFYMLSDYLNAPQGIAEYRQALRDITEQPGFPHSIQWPELLHFDPRPAHPGGAAGYRAEDLYRAHQVQR